MAKTAAARGNRGHSTTPRNRPVQCLFNDDEMALVDAAAGQRRLRPGAWVAQIAVDEARREAGESKGDRDALVALRQELAGIRRLLGNIGGNLNDVARHANTTGELSVATSSVLEEVRRQARSLDGLIDETHRALQ